MISVMVTTPGPSAAVVGTSACTVGDTFVCKIEDASVFAVRGALVCAIVDDSVCKVLVDTSVCAVFAVVRTSSSLLLVMDDEGEISTELMMFFIDEL